MDEILKMASRYCNGGSGEEFGWAVENFLRAHPCIQQVVWDELVVPLIENMAHKAVVGLYDTRNAAAFKKAREICENIRLS